jgi:hypothetical protein
VASSAKPAASTCERVFEAHAARGLDDLDDLDRRRVVAPRLLADHRLDGEEGHHRFRVVQGQGRALGAAAPSMSSLPSIADCSVPRATSRSCSGAGDRVDGAGLERRLGALVLARGHPHHRLVDTDDARQAYRAAPARQDAKLGFRQADLRRRAHDAQVAGETDFQAAAHGKAVDHGDGGVGQLLQAVEVAVVVAGKARISSPWRRTAA